MSKLLIIKSIVIIPDIKHIIYNLYQKIIIRNLYNNILKIEEYNNSHIDKWDSYPPRSRLYVCKQCGQFLRSNIIFTYLRICDSYNKYDNTNDIDLCIKCYPVFVDKCL